MDTINAITKGVRGLHGNIATDVWPKGATLTCRECGDSREIDTADCGHYLRQGWPKCCGHTMRMSTREATEVP